ncbi:MAG: T9SS type A sorting domain-containing protein [Bacteroidia bacterium]|nr:T9SS type A sorting domain-containing protein [Bacteroidia bacterium]
MTTHAQFKKRSALFIGNSYTYFNNLPQLVQQLALANGDSLDVDSYAPGGYTFNNHYNDANCLAKIYSKDWDFVILQAQSQEPSFSPAQVNAQTLPYALKLDSVIKDNHACSKTVFFETWGRKFGDASNCAAYPPVCTYTGMQNRLKQSYTLFANLTSGLVAPAGEAFRESILQQPGLELYQPDQSHPSVEGSYLSAAVFYETLFQKTVISNTFISSIPSATANLLQNIAHQVVRDSLQVWNLGVHLPWADYTYTVTGTSAFQFQSYSPSLNSLWYFGDGSFGSGASPTHTYAASGQYTVSHVVHDNCVKDSVAKVVVVTLPLGIKDMNAKTLWTVFPNPSADGVYINSNELLHAKVFTLSGELVLDQFVRGSIPLSVLEQGIYLLELENGNAKLHHRLIVNRQ